MFPLPRNSCTSSQETWSTGQRAQSGKRDGFDPITAAHSACVTSYFPSQNPRLIRTWVTGCSPCRVSSLVEPMRNSPGGIHTNSIPSGPLVGWWGSCPVYGGAVRAVFSAGHGPAYTEAGHSALQNTAAAKSFMRRHPSEDSFTACGRPRKDTEVAGVRHQGGLCQISC